MYNVHTAHLQYENKKNYEPELPLLSQAQEASIFCCKSPAMIVNYIMVLYDEMKGLGRNTKEEDKEIHCDIWEEPKKKYKSAVIDTKELKK